MSAVKVRVGLRKEMRSVDFSAIVRFIKVRSVLRDRSLTNQSYSKHWVESLVSSGCAVRFFRPALHLRASHSVTRIPASATRSWLVSDGMPSSHWQTPTN
jgi:hypothetical protein